MELEIAAGVSTTLSRAVRHLDEPAPTVCASAAEDVVVGPCCRCIQIEASITGYRGYRQRPRHRVANLRDLAIDRCCYRWVKRPGRAAARDDDVALVTIGDARTGRPLGPGCARHTLHPRCAGWPGRPSWSLRPRNCAGGPRCAGIALGP